MSDQFYNMSGQILQWPDIVSGQFWNVILYTALLCTHGHPSLHSWSPFSALMITSWSPFSALMATLLCPHGHLYTLVCTHGHLLCTHGHPSLHSWPPFSALMVTFSALMVTLPVCRITVGHRTFSDQFCYLTGQFYTCAVMMSAHYIIKALASSANCN